VATRRSAEPKSALEEIEVRRATTFRSWLKKNHKKASGVWVVFYKKHHKDQVPLRELMDEALCFGWIDSTLKRIDEDRTKLRFAPRKPKSHWAQSNKRAVARLEKEGRMTDAGRALVEEAKANGAWVFLDDVDAPVVPDDLAAALKKSAKARRSFEALTRSRKKNFLYWLKSAKRQATRDKRIAEIVLRVREGLAPDDPLPG
jgi:uncharacterized protein YdeI (YjbR/CyaY-like superfamily)